MGASRTSDNKTVSDKYRDVAAANPGRDMTSTQDHGAAANAHMETFKFDKAADEAAKASYHKAHPLSTLYTTEGQDINTAERQRARIKAQMNSKNRR
jgi:hypothetical protein